MNMKYMNMKKNPFFTIICPNYKTEPFLEECLLSVKNQTFKDFECILVNDESPGVEVFEDKTTNTSSDFWFRQDFKNNIIHYDDTKTQWKNIFDNVSSGDDRFICIDQKNTGQGIARNNAIKIAKGKRVVFLDCDDFLPLDYLQNAYNEIVKYNEPTIFYGNIKTYLDGVYFGFEKQMKHIPKKNTMKTLLVFPTWTFNPTNYFWEIDFIRKNDLYYPGKIHDDLEFIYRAVTKFAELHGKKHLDNFIQLPVHLSYRIFPFQTSKANDYQANFFNSSNLFLKTFEKNIKEFGIIYYLLLKLIILRFSLYELKLKSKNKFFSFLLGLLAKPLTILSIVLSRKEYK